MLGAVTRKRRKVSTAKDCCLVKHEVNFFHHDTLTEYGVIEWENIVEHPVYCSRTTEDSFRLMFMLKNYKQCKNNWFVKCAKDTYFTINHLRRVVIWGKDRLWFWYRENSPIGETRQLATSSDTDYTRIRNRILVGRCLWKIADFVLFSLK